MTLVPFAHSFAMSVFKEIRFPRARLADDHGVAVLIKIAALPQIENERIPVRLRLILAEKNTSLVQNASSDEREHRRKAMSC